MTVLERARRYVSTTIPAVSGSGGHARTMAVARTLITGFGLNEDEALELLREFSTRCLPPWREHELRHKVQSALRTPTPRQPGWMLAGPARGSEAGQSCSRASAPAARPPFSPDRLRKFAGDLQVSPAWLFERSPVSPDKVSTIDFLHFALRDNESAVIFSNPKSQGQALFPRQQPPYSGPNGVWFLCQPVDGQFHHNPRSEKRSRRSEESVLAWRYLLLESDEDEAPPRIWLAALARLPLPIFSIVSSGGDSVHVLLKLDAESKADWDAAAAMIMPGFAVLGADPKATTAVRLTRLPGCLREKTQRRQKLLFIDPDASDVPLIDRVRQEVTQSPPAA